MRVALLSSLDVVPGEPQGLRGGLLVGGRSVLRHQLALALAFGCKRIVALAEMLTGDLVALQHIAEDAGARFHVVASTRAIVPLVAPEDELLVLADGLLAMPTDALRLLEPGPGVLTLPVETGIAAGFERIDINHAFAGAMRVPGRIVAGLGDLPSEWNPVSALLRLAAQARLTMRDLPAAVLDEGRWRLLRSEAEAHALEPQWLRLHTAGGAAAAPTDWLAGVAVRLSGPALLHAGTRPLLLHLAALVLVLLGLGAGWFGWAAPGLVLCGLAVVVSRTGGLLAGIERNALLTKTPALAADRLFGWMIDAALVALCAWRSGLTTEAGTGESWALRWFAPLVLVLVLRLLVRVLPNGRAMPWLADRLVTALMLALLTTLGAFDVALRLLVMVLLGGGLIRAGATSDGKLHNGSSVHGQGPNRPLTSKP